MAKLIKRTKATADPAWLINPAVFYVTAVMCLMPAVSAQNLVDPPTAERRSYSSLETAIKAVRPPNSAGEPESTQTQLLASDGVEGAQFGTEVAISGDTAVVYGGGPLYPLGTQFHGAIYIFVRTGTTWTEQQRLLPTDPDEVAFGYPVAISGDTVAVHARTDSNSQGKVHIYVRTDTTWTLQQTLASSAPGFYDGFGDSLAIAGNTLAVAEYRYNSGLAAFVGSTHIFARNAATWTMQQTVTGDGINDTFAGTPESIAISGDTVVVGAFGGYDGITDDPSAYIFVRNGTTWTRQQRLRASDPNPESYFGRSVGISGDTIIVGASHGYFDAGQGGTEGSAYIFQRNSTTWTQQQKLIADDGVPQDFLGWDVAISGETAIVGTINANAAYIFTGCGGAWTQRQKLTGVPGAFYGETVAISGVTAIIGARAENIGANVNQGAAYLAITTSCTSTSVSLTSAVSRKIHGGAGPFDVDLLAGPSPVESRTGGANSGYTIVLTFLNPLASVGGVAVTSGTGSVSTSGIGADAHQYMVNLTGVSNAQRITVTLTNVTDSLGNSSGVVAVGMGVLVGDSTGNGSVSASDVGQVKGQSGQPVTSTNFRTDVNAGGTINASDIGLVKSLSGSALP